MHDQNKTPEHDRRRTDFSCNRSNDYSADNRFMPPDTFYNGGAGATGVRELPLFVAKDFKIFDKYGLDVELISTDREKTLDRFATHASAHGSVNLSINAKLNSRSEPSPNS